MAKVDLKEDILEGSTPSKTLVLKGPFWTFKTKLPGLGKLKAELAAHRDKLLPMEAKMAPILAKGMSFNTVPLKDRTFNMREAFENAGDMADAVQENLFKRMEFDPKPKHKQETLTQPKTTSKKKAK